MKPKLISITTSEISDSEGCSTSWDLFGLDTEGMVWRFRPANDRVKKPWWERFYPEAEFVEMDAKNDL